jgi:hypothetical protein
VDRCARLSEVGACSFRSDLPPELNRQLLPSATAASVAGFLANTVGGDLIVGMEAADGLAQSTPGLEIPNIDGERLRLEQLLASCIEPRLPPIDIAMVDVGPPTSRL